MQSSAGRAPSPTSSGNGSYYRITIGDRLFDVYLDGTIARVDDESYEVSCEPIPGGFSIIVNGASFVVMCEPGPQDLLRLSVNGVRKEVVVKDERAVLLDRYAGGPTGRHTSMEIRAPMPGLVVKVLAEPGAKVAKGEGLIILEAMKMENELRATVDGTVGAVYVREGDTVSKNQQLLDLT